MTRLRARAGSFALLGLLLTGVDPSHAQPADAGQTPSAAQATDPASAKQAFDQGLELVRQARFREAIAAFETAYRLSPHYAVLYNISQSHARLGDLPQAVLYLERYLAEGGLSIPESQRVEREQQLAVLKRERDSKAGAEPTDSVPLTVACDLPQVQAWVDGVLQPEAFPATFLLPPGRHTLELRRRGYATDTRELTLAGAAVSVSCAETAALKPATASKRLAPVPPSSSEPRADATHAATPPSPVATYATAATGLVLVAASAGIFFWNGQREQEWQETDSELAAFRACHPDCSPPAPDDFNARQTANNDLSDSIQRFDIVALSSGIAGLALVGVGFYLTTTQRAAATPSTELSLAAGGVRLEHTW